MALLTMSMMALGQQGHDNLHVHAHQFYSKAAMMKTAHTESWAWHMAQADEQRTHDAVVAVLTTACTHMRLSCALTNEACAIKLLPHGVQSHMGEDKQRWQCAADNASRSV